MRVQFPFLLTASGGSTPISLTCLAGPILTLFNHVFCSPLDPLQFLDFSSTVEAKHGHGAPGRARPGPQEWSTGFVLVVPLPVVPLPVKLNSPLEGWAGFHFRGEGAIPDGAREAG